MARFEIYRLVLSVPRVGPLLDEREEPEPQQTRAEFLAEAFANRRDFFYGGWQMAFAPSPEEAQTETKFSGFVGRLATQTYGAGPDQLFYETKQRTWRASFLTVDISPNSQLVFFERRPDVGSGQKILKSLFDEITRQRKDVVWNVDIQYVWDENDFWQAAEKYRGEITELSFTFAPANGLKGFEKFKEFDKLAKTQANAETSNYNLKNREGEIEPSGDFVESAVGYASEGAGETALKRGRRKLFSSKKSKETEYAPEAIMPRHREPTKIIGLIQYLFGKRNDK